MSSYPKRANLRPGLPSRGEFFMTGVQPLSPLPDENCSICADALEDNVVEIIMCKHSFHTMCILTWLSATDGMRNRACPNCRVCLFDPSDPGPNIAPDSRPGLEPDPPQMMGPWETFLQEQRQRTAERRAAERGPVPAPLPDQPARELVSPQAMGGSSTPTLPPQYEYELPTREEQAAAARARDNTPMAPHELIRAPRAQGDSGPSTHRTQARLRPSRPRRSRPSRANRGDVGPTVAIDDVNDSPQAGVPDPPRELSSREIRLARRVRRREEAEAAAALRRRG